MHCWTVHDHVIVDKGDHLYHVDLQRSMGRPVNITGQILCYTASQILMYQPGQPGRLLLLSIPSFTISHSVQLDCKGPIVGFIYDMHIFIHTTTLLHLYDQQLCLEADCKLTGDHGRVLFFVSTVASKTRVGFCSIGNAKLSTFIVEYQYKGMVEVVAVAKVDLKEQVEEVMVVETTMTMLVCLMRDGAVLRMDPFTLQPFDHQTISTVGRHVSGQFILSQQHGSLVLFDCGRFKHFPLTVTDFTLLNHYEDIDCFIVSPNQDYLLLFPANSQSPYQIYSIDSDHIEAVPFCKRLLTSTLTVTDAWLFRQHIAIDLPTLRSFSSLLLTQASESGKGSNLGTVCRVFLFLSRFTPSMARGHVPFLWLNDLDRTVTLLTTMTGKADRVVQAVDEVITKGHLIRVDDFHISEPLEVLLTLLPLVKLQLDRVLLLYTNKSTPLFKQLFALSSFRRRAVSMIGFGLALHQQIRDVSELAPVLSIYSIPEVIINQSQVLIDYMLTLSHSLAQLRTVKRLTEHEQSVSVICMIMSGDVGLHSDISSTVLQHSSVNIEIDLYNTHDSVRGCHLLQGVPCNQCRVCNKRTMRAEKCPRLFYARWNDLYQSRCVCGGDLL